MRLGDEIARYGLRSQVPGLILTLLISVAFLGLFLCDRRITRKKSDEDQRVKTLGIH